MSPRLVSIELENFRGFGRPQTVDLDADIILIRGDNGSGKTSLSDGVLWLLTGALPYLSDRVKGLRQVHDPVRNRYSEDQARVALTIRTETQTWIFERTGDSKNSTLTSFRDGERVAGDRWLPSAFGEVDVDRLTAAVSTWGVLRQDAIRSVLDTGGAALHERLSSVIGLADVTRFRDACRTATRTLTQERRQAQERYAKAQESTGAAERNLASHMQTGADTSTASLAERLAAAVADLDRDVRVDVSRIRDLDGLIALGRDIGLLVDLCARAAQAYDAYIASAAAVTQSSRELEHDLEAAQSQAHELGRLTSDTQRLAEAALALLGDRCPVCDQVIDSDEVAGKLQEDLKRNSARLLASAEARNAVGALQQRIVQTRAAESARNEGQEALARHRDSLADALEMSQVHVAEPMRRPESFRALLHRMEELRTTLRTVYAEAEAESQADASRFTAVVAVAKAEESKAEAALALIGARHDAAKRLEGATQTAADSIVARWLRKLEPSFAEVFDRLAPHPTFSELRARQDVFYNKNQIVPEVVDPIRGVSANPLLVYSEGQLNTVALSYFLGLALNAPSESLGFMVLDDPLQAMDVLAVLGFADLCRRLRRQRQLVITTHDRRYADLLARKLAPREVAHTTLTHEFEGWSPVGPRISSVKQNFVAMTSVLNEPA